MASDLTTKAAEIRAGLVDRLHDLASPERVKHGVPQDVAMTEAAALIEQQAAELAEARREKEAAISVAEMNATSGAFWAERGRNAESERDELLREKERMEAALEPFARADRALGRTPGSDRTFRLETDTGYREIHRDAFRRARSVLENSKAGLADAHPKSPDQPERDTGPRFNERAGSEIAAQRQQEEREPNGHRKNSCSEPGGNSRPLGEE